MLQRTGSRAWAVGRQRTWTRERIVAQIRQFHAQSEELSYSNIKRLCPYLLVAARQPRNFGSWRAAVEAAGLDYRGIARRKRSAGRRQE